MHDVSLSKHISYYKRRLLEKATALSKGGNLSQRNKKVVRFELTDYSQVTLCKVLENYKALKSIHAVTRLL